MCYNGGTSCHKNYQILAVTSLLSAPSCTAGRNIRQKLSLFKEGHDLLQYAVSLQRRRLFVLNARVEAQCAYCASIVQGMSRMKKHVRSQTPCAKLQRAIYTLTVSVKKSCQKSTDLNDFSVHRILKKFYISSFEPVHHT